MAHHKGNDDMRKWLLVAAVLVVVGVVVRVWRPGGETGDRQPAVPSAGLKRIEIRAIGGDEGHALEGRVLDASGAPLQGAQVQLISDAQPRLTTLSCDDGVALLDCTFPEAPSRVAALLAQGAGRLEPALSTVSEAGGHFRFERLRGASFAVWATGTEHGAAMQTRAAPGETMELRLPRLRSIAGRVIDERGGPIEAARVWAVSRKTSLAVEVRTDASGTFTLQGLGEGPFYVVAAAEGHLAEADPVVEAGPRKLELQLIRPRELLVTVHRNGRPVAANVRVTGAHVDQRADTLNGQARFAGLGRRSVTVWATSGRDASLAMDVDLHASTAAVTLNLLEAGTLRVTAVDEDGRPVDAPTLFLQTASGRSVWEVKADTGTPVLFGPIGVDAYHLVGQAPAHELTHQTVRIRPGETSIELVMRRGTTISGRVLDLHGRGASGVRVNVDPGGSALTDTEGRFTALAPSPGVYRLHAQHSDLGRVEQTVSAPAEGVELSLGPGASLRLVASSEGRPLEGARAWATDEAFSTFESASHSGPDGVVWLHGLGPGPYEVSISHPDHPPVKSQSATVAEGQQVDLTFELIEGGTVEGEAVDAEGRPVSGAVVFVRAGREVLTDAYGHFIARGCPLGTLEITASHPDFSLDAPVPVQSEAGKVAKAKLVFTRDRLRRGTVVTGDGRPLTRFRVRSREFFEPSGRFELPESARDTRGDTTVELEFEAPGYLRLVRTFPAAQLELGSIELHPAPRITGRVVDEGGSGIVGVTVGCRWCGRDVLTGDDGRFEFEVSGSEDRIRLVASKGLQTAEAEVLVTERNAELVLRSAAVLSGTLYDAAGRLAIGGEVWFGANSQHRTDLVATGEDGSFRYEASPGLLQVKAVAGLGDEGPEVLHIVNHDAGGTTLVLGRAPGTARLTVKVPSRRGWFVAVVPGDVLPGAPLRTTLMAIPGTRLVGAESGHFVSSIGNTLNFPGLTPGRYTVVFGPPERQREQVAVIRRIDVQGDQMLRIEERGGAQAPTLEATGQEPEEARRSSPRPIGW